MSETIQSLIEYFGLNYQPATFPELFQWFVLVIIESALTSSIIRFMFWTCAQIRRGGRP